MREVVVAVRTARFLSIVIASAVIAAAGVAAAEGADAPPKSPEALPLRLIKPKYEKAKVKGTSPVTITTAGDRWSYAASINIPEKFSRFESCDVTATLKVKSGKIAIGALTRDQQKFVAQSGPIASSRKSAPKTITVSPMKDVGELVFSNAMDEAGKTSTVEVSKVTVGPCK